MAKIINMRKYVKKQCLESIASMSRAHREIANFILRRQTEDAAGLLEQCQQEAIMVGTQIEESEGEGTKAVHLLENYCELVYQFHQILREKMLLDADQMRIALDELLQETSEILKCDIPTQVEAVFLPYKASMWDSLESVWEAAEEDPDCNAVVIPIPYFDKDPEGSFRDRHYEFDRYPPQVPVVKYTEYDFESRHPDVIFIHNPYDDGNYVTSVHPFFYSRNLKKYTDELVYIPYFILGEIEPDDEEAVKGMEHFVTVAAVIHADHVIVQSDKMRQIYIDVMTRQTEERMRPYWEKKILGLGSPKVDKVCNKKREDYELLPEWERLMFKPDGARKKVVFYNTTVSAFMKYGGAVLKKIETNFKIFQENREDIVLWWRPHPLTEATLRTMHPELLEEYLDLVDRYCKEGWGIYDDSADMDRAIVISDGYYGDWSSIVWLYQKTGKPIMIQNVELVEEE